ncbi:MAG: nucleoside deaminase [Faecalibacillus sp.]
MNDIYYMELAYQEALKALQEDEVPIGSIIVRDGKIIASSYNQREKQNQVTAHAEITAIQKACQCLNSWRLDDCILYTTLEPCLMCSGAIIQSRIKKVVYGASADKWISLNKLISLPKNNFNHVPQIQGCVLEEKCTNLIKNYFKKKR